MALTPEGCWLYVTIGRANQVAVIDTQTIVSLSAFKPVSCRGGVALVQVEK